MACPHRQEMPNGIGVYCQLVDIGTPQSNPCATCVTESNGVVPTLETLTPTLEAMRKTLAGHREPPKVRATPSFGDRVVSAFAAFTKFVASGGKLLDADAKAARLKICDGCDRKVSYLWMPACQVCGCWIDAKSSLPDERCPLGKWHGDKEKPPCGKPCGS